MELYIDEWGNICRDLPDGRVLTVTPMTFGKGRVHIQQSKTDLSLKGGW